jgi:hypothetical protein
MLWSTLKPYYPDPGTFIPSMVIILKAWVEAFTTWLEDEGNEEAVDRMLGALKDVQGLMLALEVIVPPSSPIFPPYCRYLGGKILTRKQIAPGKEGKEQRPSTAWSSKKSTFLLLIPKAEPSHASTILAGFASNLLELFTQSPSASPVLSSRAAATAEDPDHDSWAHLSLDSPQSEPQFAPPRKPASSASPLGPNSESEYLPEISAIQRPEEMTKKPPYWLIVRQEGKTRITVEASHGPSLVVLEGWLRKWCRGDTSRMNRVSLCPSYASLSCYSMAHFVLSRALSFCYLLSPILLPVKEKDADDEWELATSNRNQTPRIPLRTRSHA